jgi:hypothetical protein
MSCHPPGFIVSISVRRLNKGRLTGKEGLRMERKMKNLFDYQKFEGNGKLQHVIDSVHAKYAMRELDENDLLFVNAAGSPAGSGKNPNKPEGK